MDIRVRRAGDLYCALSGTDILGVRFFASDYLFSSSTAVDEGIIQMPTRVLQEYDETFFKRKNFTVCVIHDRFSYNGFEREIQSAVAVRFHFLFCPGASPIITEKIHLGAEDLSAVIIQDKSAKPDGSHLIIAHQNCDIEINEKSPETLLIKALPGISYIRIFSFPGEKCPKDENAATNEGIYERSAALSKQICSDDHTNRGFYECLRDSLSLIYNSFDRDHGIICGISSGTQSRGIAFEAAKALICAGDTDTALSLRPYLGELESSLITVSSQRRDEINARKEEIKNAVRNANASLVCGCLPFEWDDAAIISCELPCDILTEGSCQRTRDYLSLCRRLLSFCGDNGIDAGSFAVDLRKSKECESMFAHNFIANGVLYMNYPNRSAKVMPRTLFGTCPSCRRTCHLIRMKSDGFFCPQCASNKKTQPIRHERRFICPHPYLMFDPAPDENEMARLCVSSFCRSDEKGVLLAARDIQAICAYLRKKNFYSEQK